MSMKLLAPALALVLLAACETGSELDEGKAASPPPSTTQSVEVAAAKPDPGVD